MVQFGVDDRVLAREAPVAKETEFVAVDLVFFGGHVKSEAAFKIEGRGEFVTRDFQIVFVLFLGDFLSFGIERVKRKADDLVKQPFPSSKSRPSDDTPSKSSCRRTPNRP